MSARPFIPKDNQEIPDHYVMKVHYVTGKVEEFTVAQHVFDRERGLIDFCSKDDLWSWIPIANALRIEFDKNFSKLIEIANKAEIEKKAKQAS